MIQLTDPEQLATLLEGILLAAGKPLPLEQLQTLFDENERPDSAIFEAALTTLAHRCNGRALELKQIASGYRLQIRQELTPWIGRLFEERPQRYSRALLETLALIAYRQPITRGEIEEVRGVAVNSQIIRTLMERDWIRVVGHREVPGRPAMLATTRAFLDYFNLASLNELPPLSRLGDLFPPDPIEEPLTKQNTATEDEDTVPASIQALADLAIAAAGETLEDIEEAVAPGNEETSFRTLLAELNEMEQGLKTDFDDLLKDSTDEALTAIED